MVSHGFVTHPQKPFVFNQIHFSYYMTLPEALITLPDSLLSPLKQLSSRTYSLVFDSDGFGSDCSLTCLRLNLTACTVTRILSLSGSSEFCLWPWCSFCLSDSDHSPVVRTCMLGCRYCSCTVALCFHSLSVTLGLAFGVSGLTGAGHRRVLRPGYCVFQTEGCPLALICTLLVVPSSLMFPWHKVWSLSTEFSTMCCCLFLKKRLKLSCFARLHPLKQW